MKKSNESAAPRPNPTEDEIRAYARRLYVQSGYLPGRDLSNWLEAEAALRGAGRYAASAKGGAKSKGKSLNTGPIADDLDSKAVARQLDQEFQPLEPRSPTSL